METGRPVELEEGKFWLQQEGGLLSPSPFGAHNWMPMSYSPVTGLVYIPVLDMHAWKKSDPTKLVGSAETDFFYSRDNGGPFKGELLAWDPVEQEERWRIEIGRPYQGGTMVTAGGLVFQGTTGGAFCAYDAETGHQLWTFDAGSGILAAPTTVELDGKQMIFIPVGTGSTAALAYAPGLADRRDGPARLLAFSLTGEATLPIMGRQANVPETPTNQVSDPELIAEGKKVFGAAACQLCHGKPATGGIGSLPNLQRVASMEPEVFEAIIRQGVFTLAGMPDYSDSISEEQARALQAYITYEIWKEYESQKASTNDEK